MKSEYTHSSCVKCKSYHQSIFCTIAKDKWISKKKTRFEIGEILYEENELIKGVFCIKSGQVAIMKKDLLDNNRAIGIIRPGEIPGASSLLRPAQRYTTSAQAIQPVEACFIRKTDMLLLINYNPKIAINFLKMLAEKLSDQEPFLRQSIASY